MPTKSVTQTKAAVEISAKRNYWGLIRELAVSDFKLKYQGSFFGYLWSLMKPLALFGVLYLIFGVLAKFSVGLDHYPLYLLIGVVLWNYFAESTSNGMRAIVDKGDLIRKVYFPRIVIVLAASISALITLVLNLVIVAVFMVLSHISIHLSVWLFIPLIIELYLLSLGVSFFLAALFVKYRDFAYIWEVGSQMLFYASAIIFPMNIVPAAYRKFLLINPVSQIIQDSRRVLSTPQTIIASEVIHSAAVFLPYLIPPILAILGYIYFERSASRFAEDV
jgi:ABC-2 type transport system permease protein